MRPLLIFISLLISSSSFAVEVSEVDCLGEIESLDLTNDQLDELSKKCEKEADDLFKKATERQDKALMTQSNSLRKSATIAKTLRQNRMKNVDKKKADELRKVQKGE